MEYAKTSNRAPGARSGSSPRWMLSDKRVTSLTVRRPDQTKRSGRACRRVLNAAFAKLEASDSEMRRMRSRLSCRIVLARPRAPESDPCGRRRERG